MRVASKSSFAGLTKYITDSQGKTERLGEVRLTNCSNTDVAWAVRDVETVQARNQRAQSDKTYHLLIAFAPGEMPSPDTLHAIEDRICAALGYAQHQRISAVHHDTDCVHIHVAINKIHPTRHTIHEPRRDYRTMGEAAAALELEFGLKQINHTGRKSTSENKAEDMERHAGLESLMSWIRSECIEEFRSAQTWSELHAAMHANGLELRARGNGLVIHDDKGTAVKASTVARDLSMAQLVERLGAFEPNAGQGAGVPSPPGRSYEPRPVRVRVDTATLFAAYKAEQEHLTAARSAAVALASGRYKDQIESAKRAGRLRRATIKLMGGSAVNKRIQYALASKGLKAAILKAREDNQYAKRDIAERLKRRAWADWLRHQAANGNAEALSALRAREASQGLKGDTLEALGDASGFKDPAIQDGVTKQGTVIYRGVGGTGIRDDGTRIQVASTATPAGMAQALQMAAQRYGNRIRLKGSAAFKDRAVRAAAAARLHITFTDAALEERRSALVHFLNQRESNVTLRRSNVRGSDVVVGPSLSAGPGSNANVGSAGSADASTSTSSLAVPAARSGAAYAGGKPNIGRVGSKPPATRKHRLRNLSELSLDGIGSGSQMLLPSHVPDLVEQQQPAPDQRVRRAMDRGGRGVEASARDAAIDKYISERESKRAKGINIPKHVRYTDNIGSVGVYAGTRTSDGQMLALVKFGDDVAVLGIDQATANRLKRIKVDDPVFFTPEGSIRIKGRSR